MSLARRGFLGLLALGAAAAGAGLALDRGLAAELREIIRAGFGERLADSTAADAFIAAILPELAEWDAGLRQRGQRALWRLGPGLRAATGHDALAAHVEERFVLSTTAVRAWETGEAPVFLGLGDAYAQPCANPLAAAFL